MPRLFQVDSFTAREFSGNPAAVCLLEEPASAAWMLSVAAEMNLSETAFLVKRKEGFDLRWFTPSVEVDLCGHATLAAGFVLWQQGLVPEEEKIRFNTKSGWLELKKKGEWIEMDFPARPVDPADPPEPVLSVLGIKPLRSAVNPSVWLFQLESEDKVRALSPDFNGLISVCDRPVIVTAESNVDEFDFVSRFFAPTVGIDEDPVTGSAHCCLGPFWRTVLGKNRFTAFQASSRGGVVQVSVEGDRVKLGGQAVGIFSGELSV
jgi:PhzF family phenazine biosynthesis protein